MRRTILPPTPASPPHTAGCTESTVWSQRPDTRRARRHQVCLPGHSATVCHFQSRVVGIQPVCRGLHFRQRRSVAHHLRRDLFPLPLAPACGNRLQAAALVLRSFYFLWGGTPFPRKTGSIPPRPAHSNRNLDLQPGELVRIKPHDEILKTLDTSSRNRGLYFDAEEVPYCGGTYRVLRRVDRIVNERTGRIAKMKTPCVILDTVVCQSRYSECRLFCPRSIYSYWREIWLERVGPKPPVPTSRENGTARGKTAKRRRAVADGIPVSESTVSQPLISVVTPFHNTALYFAQCIESVLAQTYSSLNTFL